MNRTLTTATLALSAAALTASSLVATPAAARQIDDVLVDTLPPPPPPGGIIAGSTPPIEVIHVETDSNFGEVANQGTVLVAETTAGLGSADPGWWLRLDVTVRNDDDQPIAITNIGVDTDVSTPHDLALADPVIVEPGATKLLQPSTAFEHEGTAPTALTINVSAEGYAYPAQATYALETFTSDTPTGGYRFPGRGDANPPGVFWKTKGFHNHIASQRYAYDLGAARWDEDTDEWTGWSELADEDAANGIERGSKLEHHLVYGLPVFAMADGVIEKCRRSYPDNEPGVDGGVENALTIDHGNGEHAAYAHLQFESIPAELCPVETPGSGVAAGHVPVPVQTGDFLGYVGNSGTAVPHLHVHLVDAPPTASKDDVRALPLNFHDMFVHEWSDGDVTDPATHFDPDVDTPDWNWVMPDETAALGVPQLIHPNTCGYDDPVSIGDYTTSRRSTRDQVVAECDAIPDMLGWSGQVAIAAGGDDLIGRPDPEPAIGLIVLPA